MPSSSMMSPQAPVKGFRPQYTWKNAFALDQFTIVRPPQGLPPDTTRDGGRITTYQTVRRDANFDAATYVLCVLCASVSRDLHAANPSGNPEHHSLDTFTVTSAHTGTTILFGYVRDQMMSGLSWVPSDYRYFGNPLWAQVYRPTTIQNDHVPNITTLRRTVLVYLFP